MFSFEEMKCSNCHSEYEGNFCPNCGQRSGLERLTMKEFFNVIPNTLLLFEQRYYRTIRDFIRNPYQLIKDYSTGKRRFYSPPIQFFYFFATVSLLLDRFFGPERDLSESKLDFTVNADRENAEEVEQMRLGLQEAFQQVVEFTNEYTNIVEMFLPVIFGLVMFIFYRKKFNLAECYTFSFYSLALVMEVPSFFTFPFSDNDWVVALDLLVFVVAIPLSFRSFGRRKWLHMLASLVICGLSFFLYLLCILGFVFLLYQI